MNPTAHFNDIYKQHAAQVLRMCMAYTDDETLAQDLLQETFIKVWQNLSAFRGDAKLSTWIYRIAVNTCLSHIRSPKNKPAVTLPDTYDKPDETSHAVKEQQLQQLYTSVQQLPETDRLIISMVLEAIPYADIAEAVNINEGNLRVRIHRIKQELTKIFFRNENI